MAFYRCIGLINGIIVLVASVVVLKKIGVDAAPIKVYISFSNEETFEVSGTEWRRSKRSIADDEVDRSKRSGWSANALAGHEEVQWDDEDKESDKKDYEVVDLTKKGGIMDRPVVSKIRGMILVPIVAFVLLFLIFFYYKCCLGKKAFTWCFDYIPCCAPLHPQRLGRQALNTYMPGVVIDQDGNTEYYEITEEEQEALREVADNFVPFP